LGYQRYYSNVKYVLMIVAVLFLFLAGNRYMLSQQSVDKGVDSYWVLHEAGTNVPYDSVSWNQGQRVDAGMTKQQLDFKLVIDEFSIAQ
jgi:hypothetical protein